MKTKIIATIGPPTLDFGVFKSIVDCGLDIVRINTAYGNIKQYDVILENIKRAGKPIKVLFDIKSNEVLDYFNKNNLDMIAISFAESHDQIKTVRSISPQAFIISKIESKKGVVNFNEILSDSDGVMIARGDLGEAVTLEKVPCLQKKFTIKSLSQKKFVIAATEMLLSMSENPTPTRAEVSDVANAVFDGVDAVMLSEETAIGKHPVAAVSYMRRIIYSSNSSLQLSLADYVFKILYYRCKMEYFEYRRS